MQALKKIWSAWKAVAHVIGDFQARLLLSLFYFVVMAPFALSLKVFSDPLQLRRTTSAGWLARNPFLHDGAAAARRQY